MFSLNQRLKDDTVEVTSLELCLVLLMNDRTLPWLILVPKRDDVREIHELKRVDRQALIEEVSLASKVIQGLYGPDKINIGALGNLVPQLHVHVIGRFKNDRAWPGPVWGKGGGEAYSKEELGQVLRSLKEAFARTS